MLVVCVCRQGEDVNLETASAVSPEALASAVNPEQAAAGRPVPIIEESLPPVAPASAIEELALDEGERKGM